MKKNLRRANEAIRAENEAKILKAASRIFASKGYSAATTQAIADSAGLPKSNIHYYFGTKSNIYQTVLDNIFDILLTSADSFEVERDPVDAFSDYIRQKVEISRDYPDASKLFAHEVMQGAPNLKETLKERLDQFVSHKKSIIRHWVDEGLMQPVSPEHLLFLIWSSTQTYADFDYQVSMVLGRNKLQNDDFEQAVALITQVVIQGCGIRSRSSESVA